MSEEKQKLMTLIVENTCEKYGSNSMCKGDRCEYCITDIEVGVLANVLIDAGYCKASDVAREIFEEIDKLAKEGGVIWTNYARAVLANLKKKYTEGGE